MESQPNALLFTKAFYKDYGLLKEIADGYISFLLDESVVPDILKSYSPNTVRASIIWNLMEILEHMWQEIVKSRPSLITFSKNSRILRSNVLTVNENNIIDPFEIINKTECAYAMTFLWDEPTEKTMRRIARRRPGETLKEAANDSNLANEFPFESEAQISTGWQAFIEFKKIIFLPPALLLAPTDWDHKAIDDLLQNLLQP